MIKCIISCFARKTWPKPILVPLLLMESFDFKIASGNQTTDNGNGNGREMNWLKNEENFPRRQQKCWMKTNSPYGATDCYLYKKIRYLLFVLAFRYNSGEQKTVHILYEKSSDRMYFMDIVQTGNLLHRIFSICKSLKNYNNVKMPYRVYKSAYIENSNHQIRHKTPFIIRYMKCWGKLKGKQQKNTILYG